MIIIKAGRREGGTSLPALTQATEVTHGPGSQIFHHHNQFHNFSNEALADAIGSADLALKAHEAEVKAPEGRVQEPRLAPDHRRALYGDALRDQISSELDTTAVKQFLGDAWRRFETAKASRPSFASRPPSSSPAAA